MLIADQLKEARAGWGHTQLQAARIIGIFRGADLAPDSYARWERNEKTPMGPNHSAVCRYIREAPVTKAAE